jgi:hypothetical protein
MMQRSGIRLRSGRTVGESAVCVLLIALLLYNPFFTFLSISQELCVQHPPSYRATVAASELRRCTFEAFPSLIPAISAALFLAVIVFAPSTEIGVVTSSDTAVLLPQPACDHIWFRPPPSA